VAATAVESAGLVGRGLERSDKPVPIPEGTRGAHHSQNANCPGFAYPWSRGRARKANSGHSALDVCRL